MQIPFVDAWFVRKLTGLAGTKGVCFLPGIFPGTLGGRRKRTVKEKIKPILQFISSYKMLFILWLVLGIATLVTGSITRITYLCVWLCLLMEYLARSLEGK